MSITCALCGEGAAFASGSSEEGSCDEMFTLSGQRGHNWLPCGAAHAAHKLARAEMRRESAESSDDEEHFQRKEEKRLARDKARLNPMILRRPQPGEQSSMPSWESLGGLQHVVEQLKEMVILPLLYPELYSHMRISPPRGILFHGEPGTGKTLAARALAGACARASPKPVAFFARKGADCLGKFSGEAERTLRLLFEEAAAQAPAIIFLDELDGLVPARGQGSSGSDQIYASVVSTLLALMDGVADRGAVVVIGATNRLETIDAALRRPDRFDREVYFGLPSTADRLEILRVHTRRWEPQPSQQVLQAVAAATQGFAGADLQALCAGASTGACNQPHEEVSAGQEDVWTELRTELVRAGALDATENDVASGAGQQTATGGLHHTAPTASALPQTMPASQDIVVAGCGDSALGCVSTVRKAAQKASPGQLTVLFLPRIDGWAVTRTLVETSDAEAAEPATPGAHASKNCSRIAQGCSAAAVSSPFRGLVSLEARGSESPSRAWRAQFPPLPATSSRLSAGFSPFRSPGRTSVPHGGEWDPPLVGRRLSGLLVAKGDDPDEAGPSAAGRDSIEQNGLTLPAAGCEAAAGDDALSASMDVEAVCVSELWMVFEQTLRESSPSHPLLILATSHCKPAELPPLLTSFFGGGSSVGKKSAAASVVVLDAELPLREVQRAETSIEHLLQRRMDTASTRETNVEKESAAASEIRASARAPSCLPAFNAAEKERGRSILAQEFQASFHDAARRHRTTRKKLEAQGDPVAAGIAALQDQVDCWCYGIKSAVKLNDPEILRLIQAASS
ncbi:hypothetical protein WJX75_003478 [Coccomyxa subellipsoidea]|uniref:AAA+ ATPase domain-containing protein n=1 Tax=Coccomyxa subellipsoidea TaxID=248742 RepID=A0ABR2Z058_9CHLO